GRRSYREAVFPRRRSCAPPGGEPELRPDHRPRGQGPGPGRAFDPPVLTSPSAFYLVGRICRASNLRRLGDCRSCSPQSPAASFFRNRSTPEQRHILPVTCVSLETRKVTYAGLRLAPSLAAPRVLPGGRP